MGQHEDEAASERLARAVDAYRSLPPVEKALHDSDQRRSFIRGQIEREPPRDVLADEVRRLRGELASLTAERDGLRAAISWALGEGDSDFGDRESAAPQYVGRYWWRTELRQRAQQARGG